MQERKVRVLDLQKGSAMCIIFTENKPSDEKLMIEENNFKKIQR